MSTAAPELTKRQQRRNEKLAERAADAKTKLSSPWASGVAILIAILWTVPSFGLLVTSFRPQQDISNSGWWTIFSDFQLTTANYEEALSRGLGEGFLNSFVLTIPAALIPISIALLAAYAFAWVDFPGRNILFVAVFALQVVPLQVALVPLQQIYLSLGIRDRSGRCGSRTRSLPCRWRSSCCTTS